MATPLPNIPKYVIGETPAALPDGLVDQMLMLETTMLGHILYWGHLDHAIAASRGFAPRIAGRALTVQCPGPDSTMLHHAIGLAEAGDILMIDRLGDQTYACLGDGVASAAMRAGIIGAVIDGPCTDAVEMADLGFPVWCRGTAPVTTRLLDIAGRVHKPVSLGGVAVMPGDAVLADSDGVFVIEAASAAAIVDIALTRGRMVEERRQTRVPGKALGEITGASGMVLRGV